MSTDYREMQEPPRYREWIDFVFNRPDAEEAWWWSADDFEAAPQETLALFTATMRQCGKDLARFSNRQVNHGLYYLFYNGASDIVFRLMAEELPVAARLDAIDSIRTLYADCFESRCSPMLGHLSQDDGNPLNQIGYMLWDITPLDYWEGRPSKDVFHQAIVSLLDAVLQESHNPACIESALHGLGHTRMYAPPGSVEAAIDTFLRRPRSPELTAYAHAARRGCVL